MNCDKTKESSEKGLSSSFLTGRMVGRGRPLLPEILGQNDPVALETPIFNLHTLVAPHP